MRVYERHGLVCVASMLLSACASGIPPGTLRLSVDASPRRELQTRRYEGVDEAQLLVAAASQLQDLGFTVDESETPVGLIVASKERSAVNHSEVATAVVLSVLGLFVGVPSAPVYSKRQRVRVSLVTTPEPHATDAPPVVRVRVTFQRTVFDNNERVSSLEEIMDADVYQEFFARLDSSVFLEKEAP